MAMLSYGSEQWVFNDFGNYLEKEAGSPLNCPMFWTEDEEYGCSITLYPNGRYENCKDFISLYVSIYGTTEGYVTKPAKWSLSLKDGCSSLTKSCDFKIFNNSFEEDKFIDKKDLTLHGLHQNLEIRAEIWIQAPRSEVYRNYLKLQKKSNLTENLLLETNLAKDLSSLIENPIHCDIVLCTRNEEFKAHKSILAVRSPVFYDIFKNNVRVQSSGKIRMGNFSSKIVCMFLRFLYSGQAEIEDYVTAIYMLKIADKYCVCSIKHACINYLVRNLNESNVVDAVLLADTYNLPQLKNNAMDYILACMRSVPRVTMLYKIENQKPHLLTELLLKVLTDPNHITECTISVKEESGSPYENKFTDFKM